MATVILREYLTVNSVVLAQKSFFVTGLSQLHDGPEQEGDDRKIPGVGYVAIPRRKYRARPTFGLCINGAWKWDDTAHTNPRQGLIANREYLSANLGIGSVSGAGTVTVVWHRDDGSTKTATAHVLGFYGSKKVGPAVLQTTFDLNIPSGTWA